MKTTLFSVSCYVFFFVLILSPAFAQAAKEIKADEVTTEIQELNIHNSNLGNKTDGLQSTTSAAYAGIATLTIFADPTASTIGSSGLSYDLGTHAFITVKNISTNNITVGRLSSIAPGKTVSIGTWGNKTEHKGLWYNLESYFVYKSSAYAGRVSYSMGLTSTSLTTLNNYIKNSDSWSNTNNCSSFASRAWNSVASSADKISAGTPNTPKNLANNIKSKWTTQYQTKQSVPYNYAVYYAQGASSPIKSTQYK